MSDAKFPKNREWWSFGAGSRVSRNARTASGVSVPPGSAAVSGISTRSEQASAGFRDDKADARSGTNLATLGRRIMWSLATGLFERSLRQPLF